MGGLILTALPCLPPYLVQADPRVISQYEIRLPYCISIGNQSAVLSQSINRAIKRSSLQLPGALDSRK